MDPLGPWWAPLGPGWPLGGPSTWGKPGPRGLHKGLAHTGPPMAQGGPRGPRWPNRAWPTRAQGGSHDGPGGPTRVPGPQGRSRQGPRGAHKAPGAPSSAQEAYKGPGGPPLPGPQGPAKAQGKPQGPRGGPTRGALQQADSDAAIESFWRWICVALWPFLGGGAGGQHICPNVSAFIYLP